MTDDRDDLVEESGHMTDGTLLRYLDDELPAAWRPVVTSHLAGCMTCDARLARLSDGSARLRHLLAEPLPELPVAWIAPARARQAQRVAERPRPAHARPHHRAMRVAAAVLLAVLLAAALTPPAFAFVRRLVASWTASEAPPATPRTEHAAPATSTPAPTVVRFVPAGAELVVRFAASSETSALEVRRGGEASATFEVHGAAATAPVVVLPGAVEVRNAGVTGLYLLVLPPDVRAVRVEVAGREVVRLERAGTIGLGG
jgi:hypothetical protein